MKKVNSIRIFFILAVIFLIGCYQIVYWKDEQKPQEITETEEIIVEEEVSEKKEAVVPAVQTVEYKFVIVEEEDYLTVYSADKSSVYEYTDIRYSDLEESLRQKIRKGYCIKDEETLFGFLENYSS